MGILPFRRVLGRRLDTGSNPSRDLPIIKTHNGTGDGGNDAVSRRCSSRDVGVGAPGGCGGVVLGTSKTISNPFGLLGRSVDMDTSISGDGLTTHLTASGTLQFTLNDQASSGNPLAPYEGMSRMEISQKAKMVFSINSAGALPSHSPCAT